MGKTVRSGLMRLSTIVGCIVIAGCSSGAESTTTSALLPEEQGKPVITTTEAVAMIMALEQTPLSSEASAQRTVLTAWTVASPDVGPLVVDDRYIVGLQEGSHPYGSELFLQYMFGLARAQAILEGPSHADVIESGLRSLLAFYKSLLLQDDTLHDRFLDDLDRLRQQGKLREYILNIDRRR